MQSTIHAIISLMLTVAQWMLMGNIDLSIVLIPMVWLPMILGCLGMTWILSSIAYL